MKRIIVLFMMLILSVVLVGCNNESEKINIDFVIGNTSNIVQLKKGLTITNDIIPTQNTTCEIELFYDKEKNNIYMNEPINNDTTIYVRFVRKDVNIFKSIKIEKISIQDNNDNIIENINGINEIAVFIKHFDKIVFEQIQKIAYTTSSEAVYYSDDYTAFLNDKENSYSIIIFYEDNSTSCFYIGTNNNVLYEDESSTPYISILNNYDLNKILKGI